MSQALVRGGFLSTSEQLEAEKKRAFQRRLEALERRRTLDVQKSMTSSSSAFAWTFSGGGTTETWAGATITVKVAAGGYVYLVPSWEMWSSQIGSGAAQLVVNLPSGSHDSPYTTFVSSSAVSQYSTPTRSGATRSRQPGGAITLRPTAAGTYTYTFAVNGYPSAGSPFDPTRTISVRNLDVRAFVLS